MTAQQEAEQIRTNARAAYQAGEITYADYMAIVRRTALVEVTAAEFESLYKGAQRI